MYPYSSGSSELTAQKLKNIAIPDRLKCSVCHKNKPQSQYSTKQLNDVRFKVFRNGANAIIGGAAKCSSCTGKQRTEMACNRCDRVKDLDKFSLAQRRKRDPVCMICQEDVDWTEIDERTNHFTTGRDDTTVSDDESQDSHTSTHIWELTETGEYAVSETMTETGSVIASTDSEGGVPLPYARSSSSAMSKPRESVTPTANTKVLTRNNLERLSALSISSSKPSVGRVSSILPDTRAAAAASAWQAFGAKQGTPSLASSVSNASLGDDTSSVASTTSLNTIGHEQGSVYRGPTQTVHGRTFTAYDPTGQAHEHRQSVASSGNIPRPQHTVPLSMISDRNSKFPRVRPIPPERPQKLEGADDDDGYHVPGMDGDDDEDSDEDQYF